jgi:KaiC/GvpD/RAD55 family RecA-like ATPase
MRPHHHHSVTTLHNKPPPGYRTDITPIRAAATVEHLEQLDIRDMLSRPAPRHEWVWEGYVERRTLTVLHGDGGTGKSILAGHLCRAVTEGHPCLGRHTTQGNVLIIDAENPFDEIHRRLHALDFKGVPDDRVAYYRAGDVILGTGEEPQVDQLVTLIQQHHAQVVVLDSQRGLWGGDEKEAIMIRPFYRQLQAAAEALDVAIILIHHDRRTGNFSGSSDVHNSADTRLHLERPDPDKPERVLRHAKARSSAELQPAAYTFTFDQQLGLFTFTQPREPITDIGLVRQALQDDWMIATEIAERAGIRRADVMPILWELVRNREAQFMEGPPGRSRKAKCFRAMTAPPSGSAPPDTPVASHLSQTRDRSGQVTDEVPSAHLSPAFTPPLGGEAGQVEHAEPVPPPDMSTPDPDDIPF